MSNEVKAVKAARNEKTIEITLHFFTDCLDDDSEMIIPKHGWDIGMVQMTANKSHGIKAAFEPEPFQSLMDIPRAIEKVIQQNELKLYQGRSRKYSFAPPPEAAERKREGQGKEN